MHLKFLSSSLLSFLLLLQLLAGDAWSLTDRIHIDSLNNRSREFIFSNIELSIKEYDELAQEARALDYPAGEGRALVNLGVALYLNGRYEESVDAFLQAIRLFEELGLRSELATAYGELGYQMKRRDLPRAVEYMGLALAISEADRDSTILGSLYDNYGVLQEMAKDLDLASIYYGKALDLKIARNDSLGIPFSLNNLAGIAIMQGRFEEADPLLQQSDAIRLARQDTYGLLRNGVQWANLYFERGELNLAATRFTECLDMPTAAEQGLLVSECFEKLATIYEKQGHYEKALQNHKRYAVYRDSLFNVESSSRIASLEIEFETEKKDRLLAEGRLKMAARSRTISLLLASLLILVAATMAVVRYQHLKRNQLQKEMKLKGQLRRAEYEKRMAGEKLRISRELHDNIGAQLTFLTSSLDNLSHQSEQGKVKQGLDSISTFGRRTLAELRQTVWAMKNEDEGFDALVAKLKELKRHCASTGRQLDFEVQQQEEIRIDLSSGRMLNLYRIAQEAVQNSLKHSREGTISLHLQVDDQGLLLLVRDQGPGFDQAQVNHVGGLTNMRQRCQECGGQFRLSSSSEGTTITCRITGE